MTTSSRKNKGCLSAIFGFGSDKDNDQDITAMPGDENTKDPMPFRLRDDFLSTAEHSFYLVLKTMMGSIFTICPKVSLSDIFFVSNPNVNMGAYNRINRKHVDFLICDATTMKPRFAIELDDKSHNREDRMERDDFVELLFEIAELPLVRIPARSMYNTNEMGILFREALAQKPAAPSSGPTIHPFTVPVEKPSTNQTVRSVAELVSKPISRPLSGPVGEPVEPNRCLSLSKAGNWVRQAHPTEQAADRYPSARSAASRWCCARPGSG